jgi:hypothetical protein
MTISRIKQTEATPTQRKSKNNFIRWKNLPQDENQRAANRWNRADRNG